MQASLSLWQTSRHSCQYVPTVQVMTAALVVVVQMLWQL